jgi:hypothetical protein
MSGAPEGRVDWDLRFLATTLLRTFCKRHSLLVWRGGAKSGRCRMVGRMLAGLPCRAVTFAVGVCLPVAVECG